MTNVTDLRQRYYPAYERFPLLRLVPERVSASARVLEIGCGDGRNSPNLRGRVELYAGLDPDERVMTNPKLDVATIGTAEAIPWPNCSFDLVFHRMVAEHLADPVAATRETARVLKPNGTLLFETPGRWYYPMIGAMLTPHWVHEFWVKLCGSTRQTDDIFPTLYRCNSQHQITRMLTEAGLTGSVSLICTPPNYLGFHPATFMLGVLYERTVERAFPQLRGKILVEATKGPECLL